MQTLRQERSLPKSDMRATGGPDITLRPYQADDVARLRAAFTEFFRVCYVMATGGGKTIVFTFIAQSAVSRGKRVLIVAHRQEICEQISAALAAMRIEHALIAPGRAPSDCAVQVAMVGTLVRRLGEQPHFDLIVVDEAHHSAAASWKRILAAFPKARVLGVTATPERRDGKPLDMFQEMVIGPDTRTLIEQGYLTPFVMYAPGDAPDLSEIGLRGGDYDVGELDAVVNNGMVIDSAIAHYSKICPGKPAIAFCVTIEHSKAVAKAASRAGFRAQHVDGATPPKKRRALIKALGAGKLDILTNCDLISEGTDIPVVTTAILLRPTKSISLHLQQLGRVLRLAPGKSEAIILDCVGNLDRLGPPDAVRGWSLKGRKKRDARPLEVMKFLRRCPACWRINGRGTVVCACGEALTPTAEEIRIEAMARVFTPPMRDQIRGMTYWAACEWARDDVERLRQVARARGYRTAWVAFRLRELRERRGADG